MKKIAKQTSERQ